jgi:Pol polyprotein
LYGRDTLSSKDVRKVLTQKDLIDSQFAQKESKDSNDALFVKDSSRNKRSMTCNFCKKKGHLKKDCWKLKAKQSDESKSNKAIAAEASYVEGEVYDVGALVVTSEYKGGDDSWILDSGCSRHVTFNSDFFSTYQKVVGRKVTMGNEASCPIVGVGDVKFIMFDGLERTLTGVLHVPGMTRNLISLSILDKEGFRCMGEGGVLKVGKGPNLIMKGSIKDDLYMLVGSTLISSACVSTTSTKHENESDDVTSLNNENSTIIPTYPNESMGYMDLIGN